MIIYWRIVNRLVIPEKYSESKALKKKKKSNNLSTFMRIFLENAI